MMTTMTKADDAQELARQICWIAGCREQGRDGLSTAEAERWDAAAAAWSIATPAQISEAAALITDREDYVLAEHYRLVPRKYLCAICGTPAIEGASHCGACK